MASGIIGGRGIVDVKVVIGNPGTQFTISANTGKDCTNNLGTFNEPAGYTKLFDGVLVSGDPQVVAINAINFPSNNNWVRNTGNSTSGNIQVRKWGLFVKYG